MPGRTGLAASYATGAALLVAALLAGPRLDNYLLSMLCLIGIYVIFALGYNLLLGVAGQFDFGQGAFLCLGAYALAVLQARWHVPFAAALLGAGLVSVCFGLAIGLIVLRLEGFYLALVTLGFQQTIVLGVSLWTSLTGGFQGMGVAAPRIAGLGGNLSLFYIVTTLAVLLVLAANNLMHARLGRALLALRDSDIAARAMGIDLTRHRVLAYGLSAFYGGIAGGLLACLLSYITPEGFGIGETLKVLTMITVGGLGSVAGSVIGAVVMIVLGEVLRESRLFVEIGDGLLLVLFMLLVPNGLFGLLRRSIAAPPAWRRWLGPGLPGRQ